MAVTDKQILLQEIERSLADKITAADIQSVINVLADKIVNYDIERRSNTEKCGDYEEYMKYYIDAKRLDGLSENTLKRYEYITGKFMEHINVPLRDITVFHLRSYMMREKARGISDRTLQGNRQVLASFFGWLNKEGLIPNNPCANLNSIKCKKEMRLPFSDVDIEKLKEACDNARDKAMIAFLSATGCRVSEVCGLNVSDVDMTNGECTVLGKGNKERIVFLDSVAIMQLKNYLDTRGVLNKALFVGKGNKRLNPGGVRKRLNELGEKAGVENVHPHRFRRTLATNLIDRGMPIQEVAAILGHEKIDTTMTYIYISKTNVKNAYHKYA